MFLDFDPLDNENGAGMGDMPARFVVVGPGRMGYQEPLGPKSIQLIQSFTPERSFYYTNLVKQPFDSHKKVTAKLLKQYAPWLFDELKLVVTEGTRILTLGTDVAKLLCPAFSSLREDHGTLFYNPELNCEVVPTFMLSWSRIPEYRDLIKRDLHRAFSTEFSPQAEFLLNQLPDKLEPGRVYVDIETTGTEPFIDHVISVGFATEHSPVFIFPKPNEDLTHRIFQLLEGRTLVGHNFQFDLCFLELESGMPWSQFKTEDTMLMAHVLGEPVLSLKHLTTMHTNRKGSHGSGSFSDPEYLAEDVISTREVYHVFAKRAHQQWITGLLNKLVPYTVRMRISGVHIDWDREKALEEEYGKLIVERSEQLKPFGDINWGSNKQVAQTLRDHGVPLHELTPGGDYSVAEPILLEFKDVYPVVNQLLSLRAVQKDASIFLDYKNLQVGGYLHPKLGLAGTSTGRLNCTDPNLQQVPRVGPIKLLFNSRFPGGYIGLIDLAQAELRVAALLANDHKFAEAINSEDVHRYIASMLYGIPMEEITSFQRKKSKGITFGLLYGGSPAGLAKRGIAPESEIKQVVKKFYGKFPALAHYIEQQKEEAITTGQSTSPLGRIRNLQTLIETEGESSAERKGINTPIQGTASDIMLQIISVVFDIVVANKLQSTPIFGVHDSSLHDVHPEEIDEMTYAVRQGFHSLNETPLAKLELWPDLPITGEFILGQTWAHVESTNEAYYDKEHNLYFSCSSHDTPKL